MFGFVIITLVICVAAVISGYCSGYGFELPVVNSKTALAKSLFPILTLAYIGLMIVVVVPQGYYDFNWQVVAPLLFFLGGYALFKWLLGNNRITI